MRSLVRTAALVAVAGVIFGTGAAAGAAGAAMILGRTNDAGTRTTAIRSTTSGGVLRATQLGSGPAIIAEGPATGVGIELRSGALKVKGAGVNTQTAAFVIETSGDSPSDPGNCYPDGTLSTLHKLDNPYLNGRPNALVFTQQRIGVNGQGTSLDFVVYLPETLGDCPGEHWYITGQGPEGGRKVNALVVIP